jgi:hypothetical protein
MLMIGSRMMGNSWNYDAKYHIDDVRLWNIALTQEELLENQTKKLTGEEEGLMLFLNFDDTYKDVSGNGNDGIPVYMGTLNTSDLDPPVPAFEFTKQAMMYRLIIKQKMLLPGSGILTMATLQNKEIRNIPIQHLVNTPFRFLQKMITV